MKIFLVGKSASITHWLEDAAAALTSEGHEVRLGVVRHPWLNAAVEDRLAQPLAEVMAARARRFGPDLMLVIGALHAPAAYLERLAAIPGRAPLVGWAGDVFDAAARPLAGCYDLIGYTDSGLVARHAALDFAPPSLFLPHAANLGKAPAPRPRAARMAFVATPTPGRRAVVEGVSAPLAIFGPGWEGTGGRHEVHVGRVAADAVAGLYASHLAVLNVRNERNVLHGLNQRSFDPYLSATPVVTDDQADIALCFEPGEEVLVWRDSNELDSHYDRLLRHPEAAARIGEAGRRRIFAHHGFGRRLETLMAAL